MVFNDKEGVVANQLSTQQAAYQEWEETTEEALAHHGKHGVILELGCEEVHRDALSRIREWEGVKPRSGHVQCHIQRHLDPYSRLT